MDTIILLNHLGNLVRYFKSKLDNPPGDHLRAATVCIDEFDIKALEDAAELIRRYEKNETH